MSYNCRCSFKIHQNKQNLSGLNIMETLNLLGCICKCPALDEKTLLTMDDLTQNLETLRLKEKKQNCFNDRYKAW